MKKILISIGPIHGKLDSVKIITNKFKGGLAALTAKEIARKRPKDKIIVVKCRDTSFYKPDEKEIRNIQIIDVDDFFEYEKYVLGNKFDAYILAAAVANLIPKNPLKGKFPSHNYKEGDEINVPFVITRRVILHIKEKFPRSTLIGYKLFDGSDEELIKAGWELLVETKSNAIFCNHPRTAKEKKICLLPDGSKIEMDFDEHVDFINRVIDLNWYKTKISNEKKPLLNRESDLAFILSKTAERFPPYMFGCVAYKSGDGFYTTTRGKKEIKKDFAYVYRVDHKNKIVFADKKASLNAPLLDNIFSTTGAKVIVHAHNRIDSENVDYIFSGTDEEDGINIAKIDRKEKNSFNVKFHGYYSWFDSIEEATMFLKGKKVKLRDVDWESYNEDFPFRYLGSSEFDVIARREIKILSESLKRKINVLEIGSNKKARYFDKRTIDKYYAFDKFVKLEDKDIIQVKEKDLIKVDADIVIIRGSINYLDKKEIERLKKIIAKNKSILLFNTFTKPSEIKRKYVSKNSRGLEVSYYDKANGKINHYLYPEGKDYGIKHSFFYYDIDMLKDLFKGLKFESKRKVSSLYVKVSR